MQKRPARAQCEARFQVQLSEKKNRGSQHNLAYTVPVHDFQELSDCIAYATGTQIIQARSGVNFLLSVCLASSFQQGRRKQRCKMPSLQICARYPVVATVITRNMQSSKYRAHAVLALDC